MRRGRCLLADGAAHGAGLPGSVGGLGQLLTRRGLFAAPRDVDTAPPGAIAVRGLRNLRGGSGLLHRRLPHLASHLEHGLRCLDDVASRAPQPPANTSWVTFLIWLVTWTMPDAVPVRRWRSPTNHNCSRRRVHRADHRVWAAPRCLAARAICSTTPVTSPRLPRISPAPAFGQRIALVGHPHAVVERQRAIVSHFIQCLDDQTICKVRALGGPMKV